MEYITTNQVAENWGISRRRINELCRSGRIEGAQKLDWNWIIPINAKKPFDLRKNDKNNYEKKVDFFNVEKMFLEYENNLENEMKKENGIFYTDQNMVELMYNDLKIEKNAKIMDPCCGTGAFILGGIKLGYKNMIGLDNDKKAVELCNSLLNYNKIFCYDSINFDLKDIAKEIKIDTPNIIIGNPPYVPMNSLKNIKRNKFLDKVKNNGNNLFVAALLRALDFVKENGVVSYIIPKNFLHVNSYKEIRKELLNKYQIVSIVDIGAYFKKVRGEQIILTVKKSLPNDNNEIELKKLVNNKFDLLLKIKQNYFKNEILIFNSKSDIFIYEKFQNSFLTLENICTGYIGRGRSNSINAISGKKIRKFGFKNKDIILPESGNKIFIQNIYSTESGIIGTFAGDYEAGETITIITDTDEKTSRYLLGILHTRLCNFFLIKYCFNESKLTLHADAKYIKKIPIVMDTNNEKYLKIINIVYKLEKEQYLSVKWVELYDELNTIAYEIYGFSKEEVAFIENYIKNIQSKRWVLNNEK